MVGAILVGGRSSRMGGCDKSLMLKDGKPVVFQIGEMLHRLCGDCLLIGREQQRSNFSDWPFGAYLVDLVHQKGPLGGLFTALSGTDDDVFLVACDLPFLSAEVLGKIHAAYLNQVGRNCVLVPRRITVKEDQERAVLEPLCAVWPRHCRLAVRQALDGKDFSVSALVERIGAQILDLSGADRDALRNVNSPLDLKGQERIILGDLES